MAQWPPIEQLKGRPLGRVLIKMGLIKREQVHQALSVQKQARESVPIGQVLINLGHITEENLQLALAFQIGMSYIDVANLDITEEVLKQVTAQMAMTYRVLPVEYDASDNRLNVALDSADNFRATDDLQRLLGFKVEAFITDKESLGQALERYYGDRSESINEL